MEVLSEASNRYKKYRRRDNLLLLLLFHLIGDERLCFCLSLTLKNSSFAIKIAAKL